MPEQTYPSRSSVNRERWIDSMVHVVVNAEALFNPKYKSVSKKTRIGQLREAIEAHRPIETEYLEHR